MNLSEKLAPQGQGVAAAEARGLDQPAEVDEFDIELRYFAKDELAYWAGIKLKSHGDLRGAAGQFRLAAQRGMGDAHEQLEGMLARLALEEPLPLSVQLERGRPGQRELLAYAAALTFGASSTSKSLGKPWLPVSDLYPWPVTEQEVLWVDDALRALRSHGTTRTPDGSWRDSVVAAVSWGEHLLGSDGADEHGTRLHTAVAQLHILAGGGAFCDGSWAAAREHWARAMALAGRCDDYRLLLNVLFGSGQAYLSHQQPNEALKFYQLAQIAAQESGASRELVAVLAHEAWCYACLDRAESFAKLQDRMHEEIRRAGLDVDELASGPTLGELVLPTCLRRPTCIRGPATLHCDTGQSRIPHHVSESVEKLVLCAA